MSISKTDININSLPMEMHFDILVGLEKSEDFEAARTVCKDWHDIIQFILPLRKNEIDKYYSVKMQELVNCICVLPSHVIDFIDKRDVKSGDNYVRDQNDSKWLEEYESKFKNFYRVFKQKNIYLFNTIDSPKFMSSAQIVSSDLESCARSSKGDANVTPLLLTKIEIGYKDFYKKVFQDAIQSCASHFKIIYKPDRNLFNQKIKFLGYFCQPFLHFDETTISNKLKSVIIHNSFMSRMQLKSTIGELENEHAHLKARILVLRGTDDNGEIDAAKKKGDTNQYDKLVSELQDLAIRDFTLSKRINELKSEYNTIESSHFEIVRF